MPHLEFKLKFSKSYFLLFSLVLIISIIIILLAPFKGWLKISAVLGLFGYGIFSLWHDVFLLGSHSIEGLKRNTQGVWFIKTLNHSYPIELLGDSLVTHWITIIRFKIQKKMLVKSCVIFHDSLEPDAYLRLLIALKMD